MTGVFDYWSQFLFWLLAGTTVACSVAVVVTQNIVRAAVWLLLALSTTAGLFFFLGADFVGATQLLIYAGGTLILVIFGVMLTARSPFIQMRTRSGEWTLAALVGVSLASLVLWALLTTEWPPIQRPITDIGSSEAAATSPTTVYLGLEFLGIPPQTPENSTQPRVERDPAGIGYLLPFEIVSVHLLVVLIGAAYLARAKRRKVSS